MKRGAAVMAVRSAAEQLRWQTMLRDVVEHRIRFNGVLGIKVASFDLPEPRLRFDMAPPLIGHFGVGRLHGGVIAAVLDAAAGFAIAVALADQHAAESAEQIAARIGQLGTIDLRVDYLQPGLGRWFLADASINRLGKRIAATQMRLHNDAGLLIATGCAAYVVS